MNDDPRSESPAPERPRAGAAPRRRSPLPYLMVAVLVAAAALAGWYTLRRSGATAAPNPSADKSGRFDASARAMPVTAATARVADLPVRLTALGTVTARSTVTVRTRVDGQLMRVLFDEGDLVKAGQALAQVDPRPFEVALAQAQAQMARDRAQLDSAKVDLQRYQTLLATDSIARQQVDDQASLVRQLGAAIAADQATVDNARLQLSYARITSPVAGRVGLRQVDPGNLIHAGDANGLVVVTEVQPIYVVFPLPQDELPAVLSRLRAGATLPVDVFDRDGRNRLAGGRLVTVDNLVDPTTGTVKLKAEFDNRDDALFPNQFVNVRLLVRTLEAAVVVPTASVQRGAPGTYVYVVGTDSTVTVRPVTLGPADGETTSVGAGLAAGERVVTDGADKLREGARVEVIERGAASASASAPGAARGRGRSGDGAAARPASAAADKL